MVPLLTHGIGVVLTSKGFYFDVLLRYVLLGSYALLGVVATLLCPPNQPQAASADVEVLYICIFKRHWAMTRCMDVQELGGIGQDWS